MKQLGVGVIGLGYFGMRHACVYAQHPAAKLIAVCDKNPDTAAAVAGKTGAEAYADFAELLARADIEAVSICLLEIVGTKAATYLDCTDQGFYTISDRGTTGGDTHLWPEINGRIVGDLADEIEHFISATLDGGPYIQPWQEALDAIPVLDALALSARSGEPVQVAR
jgi:predicted dehydrogenase